MKTIQLVLIALLALSSGRAQVANCDRDCLRGSISQYLNALVAHNPSALPLADNIRFTEDSVEKRLGDGLWKDVSRVREYRQDVLDTRQGVAATQVVVEAAGSPALLVLRLKVGSNKKISEIETMVSRTQKEGALFKPDALQAADKNMESAPEKSQLSSRDDANRIAQFYPAGLKIGSFITVDAPFALDAYRIENGVTTAGAAARAPAAKTSRRRKSWSIPSSPGAF